MTGRGRVGDAGAGAGVRPPLPGGAADGRLRGGAEPLQPGTAALQQAQRRLHHPPLPHRHPVLAGNTANNCYTRFVEEHF